MSEQNGQKMTWRLGRETFRREVPDGEVLREATFYVNYLNPYPGLGSLSERGEETKLFGPGRTGWGEGSPYRIAQPTPDIGEWRYEIFDCDQAALTEFLTDFEISDDRIDWMTDIFLWTPFSVVRERVRDFFEDTDPEGHMFFPVRLFGKSSGQELPEKFFTWIPKRRLFPLADYNVDPRLKVRKRWPGRFSISDYATEFTHNQALRKFAAELPTFCLGFNYETAFNAETFRALKAEKFTGLVERQSDDDLDDDPTWNVGHFE